MPNATDEYRLLDSGDLRKLEQVGRYRIVRPALNAFWTPSLPRSEWERTDSVYTRSGDGSGGWSRRLPESWNITYSGFAIKVKPTGFGHLGFFAEQYENWKYYTEFLKPGMSALNLFGYSGIGSMAMARSGAKVCHLDAARGMVEWGREIQAMNPDVPNSIRWIVDDVKKFVKREIRRGAQYDLIALDPPTFGRGNKGELWKIETDMVELLRDCRALRRPSAQFTIVLSSHSPGFSISVLERLLTSVFGRNGSFVSGEMSIPEGDGRRLPAGISVRWQGMCEEQ